MENRYNKHVVLVYDVVQLGGFAMSKDQNETLNPVMDPKKEYVEINGYVVFWGLFFAALFALAVGYLCLKIGQTVDAFAPVSVLAMGMAVVLKRQNAFAETVHIQAIASAGTNVLGGCMFILPALYILQIDTVTPLQMMVPVVLGGLLGVLMTTMFRKYFVEEMHHAYPFPAGRAAAEVLSSNEGSRAKLMIVSGLIGLVYDFILNTLGWWQEVLSTTTFAWGQAFEKQWKMGFSIDTDAALLGLGYFTGLRYASVIAAGSFFGMFVVTPVLYFLAGEHVMVVKGAEMLLQDAPVHQVFLQYVRHLGIGMLAMAGVISLISMSNVVKGVIKNAVVDMFRSGEKAQVTLLRTQLDLPMSFVGVGILATTLLFAVFFHTNFADNFMQTIVAFLIVLCLAMLLSVVGISSIAFTGSEPVSGMTIFMIIFAGICLGALNMMGDNGIIAILMMASFVATCIGVAGNFMSEMKVAHLTGATPKKMQMWQLVSVAISACIVVGVMILLNNVYGFTGDNAVHAPQANAMAAIVQPLMTGGGAQWPLYIAGAILAVLFRMIGVPPLLFALGLYLPMEINTPILVGGLISYLVSHSSTDEKINEIRYSEGNTIASGLVAGGAIGALISAVLRIFGVDLFAEVWVETPAATYLGFVMYAILSVFLYKVAVRIKQHA